MPAGEQITISAADAEIVAASLAILVTETQHCFAFRLSKGTHEIAIELLKNGQYIFVSLIVDQLEYPIEHMEFYMQETKTEILQEAWAMTELLYTHETRFARAVKGSASKLALEVLREGSWTQFGYFNTAKT
ncbi:hypothetical protein [Hymenobacter lucidus]|uniref:Uncharacterized protein n=1 Tax=Hymenobacter lucidus TaxID=2880930 RepID=A0ABS8AWX1_9BACT|nr:hypothetical protein [Hymenobacter lucidus]MCB2410300.1 hypothetical protein [Hymenobacter lucidus]